MTAVMAIRRTALKTARVTGRVTSGGVACEERVEAVESNTIMLGAPFIFRESVTLCHSLIRDSSISGYYYLLPNNPGSILAILCIRMCMLVTLRNVN